MFRKLIISMVIIFSLGFMYMSYFINCQINPCKDWLTFLDSQ